MSKFRQRIYNGLMDNIEILSMMVNDDYYKYKLESIANAVDELYQDIELESDMLKENIELLEEELLERKRY